MARPPLHEVTDLDSGDDVGARLRRALGALPPGCPFSPMGYEGGTQWLIDCAGQLRGLDPNQLSRNYILTVAGDVAWLIQFYPRAKRTAKSPIDSFAPEKVANAIVAACQVMGYWSPREKVRGRGAWRGEDDHLVLNLGDQLWIRGRVAEIGRRGDMVYEAGDRLPRPARDRQDGTAASDILDKLTGFNWRRSWLDARLMFGWICAAMIGGALDFRPHVFVTGELGTGKSTLQNELIKRVLGAALIAVSDASAAGLWQSLGVSSLPAAIDEFENQADPDRLDQIIRLARQASTGGVVLRGSADHHAMQFTAQNTFLFSAIIMPSFKAQDRSRVAQLDLGPVFPHPFEATRLEELGRQLLRRMGDEFARLIGEVLPAVRQRFLLAGWDSRGADLYGTLIAAGDVALNDAPVFGEIDSIIAELEETRDMHRSEQTPEWRRCLDFLMSSAVEAWGRGQRQAIGALVLRAAGYEAPSLPDGESPDEDALMRSETSAEAHSYEGYAVAAATALRRFGIRIMRADEQTRREGHVQRYLAIANSNPELAKVFRETHWRGEPGESGGWRQALGRCPNATAPDKIVRFGGTTARVTCVPLNAALVGLVGPERAAGPDAERIIYRPDETPDRVSVH